MTGSSTLARVVLASAAVLCAAAVHAQALLPANSAAETRAQYRFPTAVEGFELVGEASDSDPAAGVDVQWVDPANREARIDVFLYRAPNARFPKLAIRELMDLYLDEVESNYAAGGLRLVDFEREFETYELGDEKIAGAEHAFRFAGDVKVRSHTLVFYTQGHAVKFRASSEELSARKLTFSALGREYYVPADLKGDALDAAMVEALKRSFVEAIKAGCMGSHITIDESSPEPE